MTSSFFTETFVHFVIFVNAKQHGDFCQWAEDNIRMVIRNGDGLSILDKNKTEVIKSFHVMADDDKKVIDYLKKNQILQKQKEDFYGDINQ